MNAPHNPRNPGDLDLDFGDAGLAPFPSGLHDGHSSLLSDGRILSACSDGITPAITLFRHLPSGALDTSFGEQGLVNIDLPQRASFARVEVLSDDGALVYGPLGRSGTHHSFVFRILPDGQLDRTFGESGYFVLDMGHENHLITALSPLADGKIMLLAGVEWNTGTYVSYFVRLDNGNLDPSFGENGEGYIQLGYLPSRHFAVTPNGSYVLTPQNNNTATFSQYLADGTPDRAFGVNGAVTVPLPAPGSALINQVTVQPDGKILAVGQANVGFGTHTLTIRLNPDGSLDSTFNGGEPKIMVFQGYETTASKVVCLPDGAIVVAGNTTAVPNDVILMRMLSNGNLDMSFGTNGQVISDLGGADRCQGMNVQDDGKILVCGLRDGTSSPHRLFLARYLG
ncbi:hypothetical protein [Pseudomonas japonica]|uniref:Delta-60 repeat domain-containing protein n=1 Tax=Pseudomonas japonica TaxID=256466 RepID=A0A239JZD8_9PSED|nr:hypothetical protein [Pseudomonas japonica]SNT11427.1 delta-60 repeat domain-containing protein [Pseudomonas japonica]